MSTVKIEENVASVKARIAAAAGGRHVTLVAATKMNDAEAVRRAIAAGVDACGENRVQEMLEKLEEDAYRGVPLHFIGTLQKNKVKFVVGKCDLIHSVNSPELLSAIGKKAESLGICQDVLLEINIGREESKTGFLPEQLPRLFDPFYRGDAAHPKLLQTVWGVGYRLGRTAR